MLPPARYKQFRAGIKALIFNKATTAETMRVADRERLERTMFNRGH